MQSTAPTTAAETFPAQVCVVLGTQWGDEGKGKLVDILAQQYDVIARAQVSKGAVSQPPGLLLGVFLFACGCGKLLLVCAHA